MTGLTEGVTPLIIISIWSFIATYYLGRISGALLVIAKELMKREKGS